MPLLRLLLTACLALVAVPTYAQTKAATPAATPPPEPPLDWHDVTKWGVEGRASPDMERLRWFDRFPASAQGKVTETVWNLSRDSAGEMVRFKTDAAAIWVNYTLRSDR